MNDYPHCSTLREVHEGIQKILSGKSVHDDYVREQSTLEQTIYPTAPRLLGGRWDRHNAKA